jgi:hypothetical protein
MIEYSLEEDDIATGVELYIIDYAAVASRGFLP